MNSLSVLLAPLALLLPAAMSDDARGGRSALTANDRAAEVSAAPLGLDIARREPWQTLADAHLPPDQFQVRIEQRIIMRVTPRPQASRQDLLSQLPRSNASSRIAERRIGSCVPLRNIASVGTGPNEELILFMRDQRIVSAELERACSVRQFYSGFLVERSNDGLLCVQRDQLQSRTGTKCTLLQLRQLVAVKD